MPILQLVGELGLAFVAGLLLNLTPCVLPAIPLKIRTIVHEAGERPAQRALSALLFAAGSLLFFLGLGVATAALHWTWGALFQSPVFLIILIAILCAFAAVTFRDVGIPIPQFAQRLRGRRYLEPFFSGAFSALLATPCTGPFLGGVLAYAVIQPSGTIIGIFLAVGVGLALPYVIMLLRPSLLEFLPKSGQWSVRVRQALAFVLLAAAAFFARSLLPMGWDHWLWVAWAVLVVVWGVTALFRSHAWSARGVAAGFAVAGIAVVYSGGLLTVSQPSTLNWRPLKPAIYKQVEQTQRPVLIEFTANWCINCKVLEKTVYTNPQVVNAVQNQDVALLRVNLTRPVPRLQHLLISYGGAGLPYAVVLNGNNQVVARFSGLFTTGSLLQAIHHSAGSSHGTPS